MMGDKRMLRRAAFGALILIGVGGLLGLCTAGIMAGADVGATEVVDGGKVLAMLSTGQLLGVAVIVLAIAFVLTIRYVLLVLVQGTLEKVAVELVALSTLRERSIRAIEYCEHHSGFEAAQKQAKEITR